MSTSNIVSKIGLIIGILCVVLGITLGLTVGKTQYQYQVDKCNNMVNGETAFDFNNDIQLNADYAEQCWYINNGPYARMSYVFPACALGTLIGLLVCLIILIIFIKFEEYIEY